MSPPALMLFYTAVLLFLIALKAHAAVQTVTVDDDSPLITYSSDPTQPESSRWVAVNTAKGVKAACNEASRCVSADLDTSKVLGGTWHEGSGTSSFTVKFFGTGVSVFSIIRDFAGTQTNVSFWIGGRKHGELVRAGLGPSWLYNYPAFTVSGLRHGLHALTVQGGSPNLFVFDYLTYDVATDATGSPTASSATSTGTQGGGSIIPTPRPNHDTAIIAGATVGGVVLLALIVGAILIYLRRQGRWRRNSVIDLTVPAQAAEMQSLVSPYVLHSSHTSNTSMSSTGPWQPTPFTGPSDKSNILAPPSLLVPGSSMRDPPPPSYGDMNGVYRP